jgi:predicted acetyltransferase
MKIKRVEEKDRERVKFIDYYCFYDEFHDKDKLNLFLDGTLEWETCFGAYDGETLMAILGLLDYKAAFNGRAIKMGGITTVATLPEFRYKGTVGKLLSFTLNKMKEMGMVVSYLDAFQYAFYRKYGWEIGFVRKQVELVSEDLKGFGDNSHSFKPLNKDNIPDMNAVYEKYIENYNCAVLRSNKMWDTKFLWIKFLKHNIYGVFDKDDNLKGYIYYEKKKPEKQPFSDFCIYELVYSNVAARAELLRFAYFHNAECQNIKWYGIPEDDPLLFELKNPRRNLKIDPNMMIRIVDVAGFLREIPDISGSEGEFTMRITDKHAEWNDGVFRVTVKNGGFEVIKDNTLPPDFECDINQFSLIVTGVCGFAYLTKYEKLTLNDKSKLEFLDALFPKKTTYMNEHF